MFKISSSSFLLLLLLPLMVSAQTNFNSAPKPQANPFSSGYIDTLKSFGLKQDTVNELSKVQDIKTRQNIINAGKGQCPSTFSVKGTDVKVEHAKQCGKTKEEKKKKNGASCTASGIQGGQVKAMCINGCCVGIGSSANSSQINNFSGQGSAPNSSQGLGGAGLGGQNQGLFGQLFGQLFQNMMGGGGDSSYSPQSYDYDSLLDSGYDLNYDSDLPDFDRSFDIYSDDETIIDNADETKSANPGPARARQGNEDYIRTVISRNGNKIEVKVDTQDLSRPVYGGQSSGIYDNLYPENKPAKQESDEQIRNQIMKNEIKAYKNSDIKIQEPASTGFKGEKLAPVREPGLLERLSAWLMQLLGF